MDEHGSHGGAEARDSLRAMLKSQYHAALAMLRDAVVKCPDALWDDGAYTNRCWQVAYHALFIGHYYMQPTSEGFAAWEGHRDASQYPDGIAGPNDPASDLPLLPEMYTRDEFLTYWEIVDAQVDAAVDAIDPLDENSGFSWYPVPKLEHALVNLRHLQHHTAQIADHVRVHTDVGVNWVGARRKRVQTD